MRAIRLKAVIDDAVLSETDRDTLSAAITFLEHLEDRGMAEVKVSYPKPVKVKPPKAPRVPKPQKPKMTPSERGRAGAAGLWGTKDNPKPRDARHIRIGRPKVPLHEKSIVPQMRDVWNALPEDGYMLVSDIVSKTGINAAGVRNNLKLLKDRGLADSRLSAIEYRTSRFLVEWKRSVEALP